jgi:hypothetical protein
MSEAKDKFDRVLFGMYARYKPNQIKQDCSGVWKCSLCRSRFLNVSEDKMDFVLKFHLNEFHKPEMEKRLQEMSRQGK